MREPSPSGSGWTTQIRDGDLLLVLSRDWTETGFNAADLEATESLLAQGTWKSIRFDSTGIGLWGSSLLAFLSSLRQLARRRDIGFDESGLPAPARQLIRLIPEVVPPMLTPRRHVGAIERLGQSVIDAFTEVSATTTLVGQVLLRTGAALHGRARTRTADLLACVTEAGVAALPVVALVNVLVGGIIAFVGAIELRRFGAGIYIANLIGVAEVREMAPIMTAIVMSGRTGSAYAAEIATMQGTEELDALRALGIGVEDYLVLPRAIALSCMMPLLNLYAAAVGIFGGFCVAISMLHISPETFLEQVRDSVTVTEVVLAIVKSIAFGAWIAIASCRIGLRAGRSSRDVGHAATTASVVGIVGVIVLDAIFAVCANALNI
jgi:phospholipid/cholesterol/gamma-HCH transport system permease protein